MAAHARHRDTPEFERVDDIYIETAGVVVVFFFFFFFFFFFSQTWWKKNRHDIYI